jgi:hypothetical protein
MKRDARREYHHTQRLGQAETASCKGKRVYASFEEASGQAEHARRRTSAALAPYRCPHCQGWHVGTPKPKPRRAKENVSE